MVAPVTIADVSFGAGRHSWILGPCSLETRDLSLTVADHLAELRARRGIGVVFKGSFDKANRTRGDSERGPGLDAGLEILAAIKRATGLAVITDIHECAQAAPAAEVVDALQIPAFLCRQTDLLRAAAATGLPTLIKKGQFMPPAAMAHAVAKLAGAPALIGERGTSFGYGDLVVDYRGFGVLRAAAPVVFDGTHAVQRPGGDAGVSGGTREWVAPLCRAAAAVGVDGFFLETHPNPSEAVSDRDTQIPLAEIDALIADIQTIPPR